MIKKIILMGVGLWIVTAWAIAPLPEEPQFHELQVTGTEASLPVVTMDPEIEKRLTQAAVSWKFDVGLLQDSLAAEQLLVKLRQQGYPTQLTTTQGQAQVWVGPLAEKDKLQSMHDRLVKQLPGQVGDIDEFHL